MKIVGNSFTPYAYDKQQLSSSCSFFANYYYFKYFVFHYLNSEKDEDEFEKFIILIKVKEIEKFLNSKEYPLQRLNIAHMLIRDPVSYKYQIELKKLIYDLLKNNEFPYSIDLKSTILELKKNIDSNSSLYDLINYI